MKKIFILLAFLCVAGTTSAMVRAGVDVGPPYEGYYYGPYDTYGWYGPGWYYGNYYYDYPTYYSWKSRYAPGPYYWRWQHPHRYWR